MPATSIITPLIRSSSKMGTMGYVMYAVVSLVEIVFMPMAIYLATVYAFNIDKEPSTRVILSTIFKVSGLAYIAVFIASSVTAMYYGYKIRKN